MYRAVFTWVSKVNCVCIGFALLRLVIGLKISHHFRSQSELKTKPIVTRSRTFSRPSCQLLRVLVGSLGCLCPLWLARVITLVLVLRHSIHSTNPKYTNRYILQSGIRPLEGNSSVLIVLFFIVLEKRYFRLTFNFQATWLLEANQ